MAFPHHQDALLNRREWNELEILVPRCPRHDAIVPMPPDTLPWNRVAPIGGDSDPV